MSDHDDVQVDEPEMADDDPMRAFLPTAFGKASKEAAFPAAGWRLLPPSRTSRPDSPTTKSAPSLPKSVSPPSPVGSPCSARARSSSSSPATKSSPPLPETRSLARPPHSRSLPSFPRMTSRPPSPTWSGLALDGASSQIGSTVASGGCEAVHDHAGRQPGSDRRKEAALCLPRGADAGASTTGTTRNFVMGR